MPLSTCRLLLVVLPVLVERAGRRRLAEQRSQQDI
jgi:hypothetical protein